MTQKYSARDIEQLDDFEHIRRRVRRYLGDNPKNNAIREIVDNAADEAGRGYATDIWLTFHDDKSIEVVDNGRGLPIDFDPEATSNGVKGLNGIVKTVGSLRSGANFSGDTSTTAGTNGEGAAATNAISQRMDVTVYRDGKEYHQSFHHGYPGVFDGKDYDPEANFTEKNSVKLQGKKTEEKRVEHGTRIRFTLDESVADDDSINKDDVIFRATISTVLRSGVTLHIDNEGEKKDVSGNPDLTGAGNVLQTVTGSSIVCEDDFSSTFTRKGEKQPLECSFAFTLGDEKPISTVNTVYTPDGGSFVSAALKAAGEAASDKKVRDLSLKRYETYPAAEDFADTAHMAISINIPTPPFVGQEKRSLGYESGMVTAIQDMVGKLVGLWAQQPKNAASLKKWASAARDHARVQQKILSAKKESKKTAIGTGNLLLPDKYLPCRVSGRGSGAELFLCEGDSAAHTIKAARNALFQACFPLRGKPKRTWGETLTKARKNQEFSGIETLLNTGAGGQCDPDKCRFDRIIFACDADTDGYNINSSLMSMFAQFFEPLIENGMVYIAIPPLFIVSSSAYGRVFCVTEKDRDKEVEKVKKKNQKPMISRCKGLGEMDFKDFAATVCNPDSRRLYQVEQTDESKDTLDVVFGRSSKDRRDWIALQMESSGLRFTDLD